MCYTFNGKLPTEKMKILEEFVKDCYEPSFEITEIKFDEKSKNVLSFEIDIDCYDVNDDDEAFIENSKKFLKLVKEYGKVNGKNYVTAEDAGGRFMTGIKITDNKFRKRRRDVNDEDWY